MDCVETWMEEKKLMVKELRWQEYTSKKTSGSENPFVLIMAVT